MIPTESVASEEFQRNLTIKVAELIRAGFVFPIHAAAIASNGHVIVMRYDKEGTDLAVTLQGEIDPDPESKVTHLPINIFFSDPLGQSAQLQFTGPRENAPANEERN